MFLSSIFCAVFPSGSTSSTELLTADRRRVIIPNSKVGGGAIVNNSTEAIRNFDINVNVAYEQKLDIVLNLLREVASAEPRVLKQPEPLVAVLSLADNCVKIVVRVHVNSSDYLDATFALNEAIKNRLDQAEIGYPVPPHAIALAK